MSGFVKPTLAVFIGKTRMLLYDVQNIQLEVCCPIGRGKLLGIKPENSGIGKQHLYLIDLIIY